MCELTILMPCLNESETLGICISKAQKYLKDSKIEGEIVVADNGSEDGSIEIAKKAGVRVLSVLEKGYGNALKAGIKAARGKYIIMGDADDSYDFLHLEQIIEKLRNGYDLVMGNRFDGGIRKGAMPPLHRYLGNPVLSFIGRLFFNSPIQDFHCGLRGFNTESIMKLHLVSSGMEFASEMVVKATILELLITEVPIILYPAGRTRPPHLSTWQDGWRHLVFLLMYSPRWLFFFPSLLFFFISLSGLVALLPGVIYFKALGLDIHTLTIMGTMVVLSYQLFLFAIFIRIYSINQGLYPAKKKHLIFLKKFTLERGIALGSVILISGIIILVVLLYKWMNLGFGPIHNVGMTFRLLIPSITLISMGVLTIFSSFFIGILGINSQIQLSNEGH